MFTQTITMTQQQYLNFECSVDGVNYPLTTNETALLATFLARPNCVLTTDDLTDILWPDPEIAPEWEHTEMLQRMETLRTKLQLTNLVPCGYARWILHPTVG